jgi:hypothetical protein
MTGDQLGTVRSLPSTFSSFPSLTHETEQYQRYFFVSRGARRPTWTNPILNERRLSDRRSTTSQRSTSSKDASAPETFEPSPAPEPVLEEQPSPRRPVDENEPLGPEPVLEEQPSLHEPMNENHAQGPEPEFEMSGAISTHVPEEGAQSALPPLEEGAQSPVPDAEERAQPPDPDHEEHTESPVHDSENQIVSQGSAEAQPHPDNAPGSPRRRDHWFKWNFRSRGKSPQQNPQSLQNQPIPPQESLGPPPRQRPEAQPRPSTQRGAQSHSSPTLQHQRQRQTQSEEQPTWMPDLTGFQGSDGARFYWLDPTFIAQREAEGRYRMAEVEAAQRIWDTRYRGHGYGRPGVHEIGGSGMGGGGSYGLGGATGYSGLA